jgi:glycerate kinase
MIRILIAPDKFKGSLTAREAAAAMRAGFAAVFPEAEIECLPVADGGEGLLDAFSEAIGGTRHQAVVQDALGRPVTGEFLMCGVDAIIESSQANGIWRLSAMERDPARTDTRGVGGLMLAALAAGARSLTVGLGGSATNDCGVGMARALGFRFLDDEGSEITGGPLEYHRIHTVCRPPGLLLPSVLAACDVANPLLGPDGATQVYGPQKGLRAEDAEILELGHLRVADAVERCLGIRAAPVPGAGAAGGLGFGLMAFCNASILPGFECLARAMGLEEKIRTASLVVTGEGALDAQSLSGKAPVGVARIARRYGVPVVAIAGCVDEAAVGLFDATESLVQGTVTLQQACDRAAVLLEQASRRVAGMLALQWNRRPPSG